MKNLKVAYIRYHLLEPSTGIGNVCKHFEKELSKFNDITLFPVSPPFLAGKGKNLFIKIFQKIYFELWYNLLMPIYFYLNKVDVYVELNMLMPKIKLFKFYFFIYDLAFLKFPETVLARNFRRRLHFIKNIDDEKDNIFTISHSTENDYLQFKKTSSANIQVAYLSSPLEMTSENIDSVSPVDTEYFLFVGTLEPRKNLTNSINAFYKVIEEKHVDFKFVLIGKAGWMNQEIFEAINQNTISKDRIVILGYLSDEELSIYYKHAFALVYPSLYEGFGLPVLEAMIHRIPVITADNSSLPEIGGDAVLYCKTDMLSIFNAMAEVIQNQALREDLIAKGTTQAAKFSWSKFGVVIHETLIKDK